MRYLVLLLLILLAKLSSAQKFTTLTDALADPSAVTHLTISCNEKESEKFIRNSKNLKQVTSLRLEGGSTTTDWDPVMKAIGHLEWLNELHLSWVEMKVVPASFDHLCLKSLIITGCSELDYNRLFLSLSRQTPGLQRMELVSNDLEKIPSEASQLRSLRSLIISDNPGLNIDKSIFVLQQLPSLASLSIRDNELSKLPSSIGDLVNLKILDISGNYIEKLPSSIVALKDLDTLYVFDNILEDPVLEASKLSAMNLRYLSIDEDFDRKALSVLQERSPGLKVDKVQEIAAQSGGINNKPQHVFHRNSLVKPMLPQLAIQPGIYAVNASNGGTIVHESGTKITIPANALMYADGKPVQGEAAISYREFNDPFEILLSGIPMTYDSGGVMNQFETAGMFELYASQGEKELFVRPGAKIYVSLRSSDSTSGYNFYALSESSSNWEYLGDGGQVKTQYPKTLSLAWRVYKQLSMNKPKQSIIDTMPFHKRFEDPAYVFTSRKKGDQFSDPGKRSPLSYGRSSIMIKPQKPVKGDRKGIIKFTVQQKRSSSKSRKLDHHPELDPIEDVVFVYDGDLNRSAFRKHYVRKRIFNDIRIHYTKGSSTATLELKDKQGTERITVSLYSKDEKASMMTRRTMARKYRLYKALLSREQKKFDSNIKARVKSEAKALQANENYRWKRTRKAMSKEERSMSKEEWLEYYANIQATIGRIEDAQSSITRNLSVTGFGIYNCDQIKRLDNPVEVFANYITPKKENLSWATAYVLDKRIRGVITYNETYKLARGGNLALDPKNTQGIMIVDSQGSIAVITGEEVRKLDLSKRKIDIPVKSIDPAMTSSADLQKMFGLDPKSGKQ